MMDKGEVQVAQNPATLVDVCLGETTSLHCLINTSSKANVDAQDLEGTMRGFKGFNGMSAAFDNGVQEADDVIIPFKLGDLDMACACVHADESLVTIRG